MKPEYQIYKQISEYMEAAYPSVIFHFDLAGNNLSKAARGMNNAIQKREADVKQVKFFTGRGGRIKEKKQTIKFPDFQICQKCSANYYNGLFLEIKAKNIYKKDGSLLSDEHLEQQAKMLKRLRDNGYYAEFSCSFDEAKRHIENYLKGN